jgi:hypothetical protein
MVGREFTVDCGKPIPVRYAALANKRRQFVTNTHLDIYAHGCPRVFWFVSI